MSAFSTNMFAVLEDDVEDANPTVVTPNEKAEEKKTPAKPADKSRAQKNEARIRPDYPQRGGRTTVASTRGSAEERPPRDRNVGPRFSRRDEGSEFIPPPEREERSDRGPREPRRGGRGGYRGRGREFDRHSGTGKFDSQKKETQAWGDAASSWTDTPSSGWTDTPASNSWADTTTSDTTTGGGWADAAPSSGWDDEPAKGWDEPAKGWDDTAKGWDDSGANITETAPDTVEGESKAGGETTDYTYEAPEPEPEEKVKTLEEYLAEKAQKSLTISLPEARKPNEGSDDSKWKNAVLLGEDEEEEVFIAGKEQTFRLKNKNKKEKIYVEIEQRFTERPGGDRRGRGGRGGFDRDRGGYGDRRNGDEIRQDRGPRGGFRGGRGGGRGGRGSNGVDVADVDAFPSLGSK